MRFQQSIAAILLTLGICLIISSADANESTDETPLTITEESANFPPMTPESSLLPLGHLLVNRTTQEALVLACTQVGTQGCERFRFAQFPHADDLKTWSWASAEFQLAPEFKSMSARAQKKALRKWIRKSARVTIEVDPYARRSIGFLLGFSSLIGSVLILDGTSGDNPIGYLPMGIAGVITLLWFTQKSEYLDIVTPLVRATARAAVSRRPDRVQRMDENFQLKRAIVRNALFVRMQTGIRSIPEPFVTSTAGKNR